jgi:hypothetical protein
MSACEARRGSASPNRVVPMRRKRLVFKVLAGLIAVFSLAVALPSGGADNRTSRVTRAMLCVTEGSLDEAPDERLSVSVPKMRAYVNRQTLQTIEAHFTYSGPTRNEAPLGSGQMRRQFGLKLRAKDPCNLVYVMWRIEPKSEIVVSIKMNPGEHTSAECGNRGYRNIRPAHASPAPLLRPEDTHTFRAEMNGEHLRVFVDSSIVWEGELGADALRLDGPVGIRSDNAQVEFQLSVGELAGAHPDFVLPCKSQPE